MSWYIWAWSSKISLNFGLRLQAALKKAKVKLDLLTKIDMLLMEDKRSGGGICHSIYWYAKANNKYMRDCDENKEFNIGI